MALQCPNTDKHKRPNVHFNPETHNQLISVSIVVFRPDLNVLRVCLNDLNQAAGQLGNKLPIALYLIDNGHTAEWQTTIKEFLAELELQHIDTLYIARPDNPGYGAGNNVAIFDTAASYHLVLNPDVFMEADCLKQALGYLTGHPNCALLAPATFYPDGDRQYLCRRNISLWTQFLRSFAPSGVRRLCQQRLDHDEYRDHDYNQPMHNVEFLTGCFMLMKTEAAKQIKGFDEKYFMYVEDADLSRRLLQVGDNIYHPDARIVHQWARLSHRKLKYTLHHIHSSWRYFCKFRRSPQ